MQTKVLAGRYRLDRQLGKGGMGSVWLAEHLALNSWVAIKLMDPAIASTVEGAERFKREAQAAASLRSAHVVQVLDYGVHEDTPFLVMELLQGQSLADCIERERRLSPERTLNIVTQIARAIGRAHAGGIIHRDLKPDNIFLVREDDQELAKVLDFGIAKTTGLRLGNMETRTGVTMGTPYYMSPEQVEGKKALDHRSDLWSLTVIACECLTGVRPFDGETYGELLLNICARPITPPSRQGFSMPGFDEWFAKGANRDPAQRFNSAQELASALGDVLLGRVKRPEATLAMDQPVLLGPANQSREPIVARATTAAGEVGAQAPPEASERVRRGRRRALGLGLGFGAVVVLALALIGLRSRGERAGEPASVTPDSSVASAPSAAPVSLTSSSESPREGATKEASPAVPVPTVVHENKPAVAASANPDLGEAGAARGASVAPTPSAAPRALRCYSDPFTGQLRVARAGHEAGSFPCRQNPFTGAYQR